MVSRRHRTELVRSARRETVMTGIGKIPEPPPGFGGERCDRIALARPCRCARGRFAHPTASGSGAGLLDARDGGPRPRVRGLWRVGVVFALMLSCAAVAAAADAGRSPADAAGPARPPPAVGLRADHCPTTGAR